MSGKEMYRKRSDSMFRSFNETGSEFPTIEPEFQTVGPVSVRVVFCILFVLPITYTSVY